MEGHLLSNKSVLPLILRGISERKFGIIDTNFGFLTFFRITQKISKILKKFEHKLCSEENYLQLGVGIMLLSCDRGSGRRPKLNKTPTPAVALYISER